MWRKLSFQGFILAVSLSMFPALSWSAQEKETVPACKEEALETAKGLYEEAKRFFADRKEKDMRIALAKLERAVKLCPDHVEAWRFLSEVYWTIGDGLPKETREEKAERIWWFEKGEKAADQALALDPENAAALYWKTTNMASKADMKGWASSLWMFPTLLHNMDKVDAMLPHYYYGATSRFWCEVMTRVPLWLARRFGYDVDKDVLADIEEEIKREPRYLGNYTYAARLYWKVGDQAHRKRALELLEQCLTRDPAALPDSKGDNRNQQKIAREMWKEYTGKEFPEK